MSNMRSMNHHLGTVALLAIALVGAACKKPEALCTTALGTYAVRYTLIEGTDACAQLTGGEVGVQFYLNTGEGGVPNYKRTPVAIKPSAVGELVAKYKKSTPDPTKLYSLGNFTEERPGSDGYCELADPSPTEVTLTAEDATMDAMGKPIAALPPVSTRYQWSKVRFWVNPGSPGTQFTAELSYTLNNCTARYAVQAIYPAAHCGAEMTDPAGMTTMVADQGMCSACVSHINPDVETACEPKSLLCLPTKPIPSMRAQTERCPPRPAKAWPDAGPKDSGEADAPAPDTAAPADGGDTGGAADTAEAADTAGAADTAADTAAGG